MLQQLLVGPSSLTVPWVCNNVEFDQEGSRSGPPHPNMTQ